MTEDPEAVPGPAPGPLEVTVMRSGGVAGMVRRWSAEIPDDGTPGARAARRIAGLGRDGGPPENRRSKEHRKVPPNPESGGTFDRQMQCGQMERGRVRDAFQWTVTCGDGSLRCDDAGRSEDAEVDELIRRVTSTGATGDGSNGEQAQGR